MTRIQRGSIAQKRRTKMRFFTFFHFRGAHSNLIRTFSQQRIKALFSSQRDRDRKKRDFRSYWIGRINAIIRIGQNKEKIYYSYSYSNLMSNLYKKQLLLNRKIVSQISILKGNCLFMIANDIIQN